MNEAGTFQTVSGTVLYLFGDRDPEIASLMDNPEFRSLVGPLFSTARPAVPDDTPVCLDAAVDRELLTSDGGSYGAGPRLVPVPALAERELPERLRPVLARYVEIAGDMAVELRALFAETSAAERFAWPQVSHSLVAGMFLDLAMGRELIRSGQVSLRPAGGTVVWAFEGLSAGNAFGVQWAPASRPRAGFAQLWSRRARRPPLRLGTAVVEALWRSALGEAAAGTPEERLYLRHLKLARKAGGSLEVQVPAFGPSDAERLLPLLDHGARQLVADAIVPALALVGEHPWWSERIHEEAYRHAAVRLILEYGIDRVIASGGIEAFPQGPDLQPAWGRWVWVEADGPLSLVPDNAVEEP